MKRFFDFIQKMKKKKTPEEQKTTRKDMQREEIPQRPLDQPAAAENPAVKPMARRRPAEEDFAQWRAKLKRCMDFSVEQMPKQVPAEGTQGVYACKFALQGTENEAMLMVECRDRTLRTLTVRVIPKGTDLCVMHYIKNGTRDELIAYLADEGNQDELLDSLRQLSDGADEHRL